MKTTKRRRAMILAREKNKNSFRKRLLFSKQDSALSAGFCFDMGSPMGRHENLKKNPTRKF